MKNSWTVAIIIAAILAAIVVLCVVVVLAKKYPIHKSTTAQMYKSNQPFLNFSSNGATATVAPVSLRNLSSANAFTASNTSVLAFDDQILTVPNTTFTSQKTTTPSHYGYTTGVYAISTSPKNQSDCDTDCKNDPYCHSCSFNPSVGGCAKSVMSAKIMLKYFASDLHTLSPFVASPTSELHFILRSPTMLTGLSASMCDCNTLCSLDRINLNPAAQGGYALGTLSSGGVFIPSGQITSNDATTRLLSWKDTQFCNGAPTAPSCPPFNGVPISSSDLDAWLTNGTAPAYAGGKQLLDIFKPQDVDAMRSLANAKIAYNAQQSDFFSMFQHAVDHKICMCVADETRKSIPMDDTVWNVQSHFCRFRLPDAEDYDPRSILTDQASFNPRNAYL
jgi:hypothetical protein